MMKTKVESLQDSYAVDIRGNAVIVSIYATFIKVNLKDFSFLLKSLRRP